MGRIDAIEVLFGVIAQEFASFRLTEPKRLGYY